MGNQGSKTRLAVLASGSGSNFEAIARAIQTEHLPAQIPILITNNPQAKVLQRAERLGIPSQILNHRKFPCREALDHQLVEVLQQHQVEWVIMAGWMRIVTEVLIDAFPRRILNIHPSLLPSFPGHKAIQQALEHGVRITGCTVHVVIPEVDQGPIVMQAAVPVLPYDTLESLQARIQVQEHRILVQSIARCLRSGGSC